MNLLLSRLVIWTSQSTSKILMEISIMNGWTSFLLQNRTILSLFMHWCNLLKLWIFLNSQMECTFGVTMLFAIMDACMPFDVMVKTTKFKLMSISLHLIMATHSAILTLDRQNKKLELTFVSNLFMIKLTFNKFFNNFQIQQWQF
jgi:hypothetical protein